MDVQQKTDLIKSLAHGIDPFSQEPFPQDSVYNHPALVRSLFEIAEHLQTSGKKTRQPPLSEEQKRQQNIESGLAPFAGFAWTDERKAALCEDFNAGLSIRELASKHERSRNSITEELKKQGLIEL